MELRIKSAGALAFWKVTETPNTTSLGRVLTWRVLVLVSATDNSSFCSSHDGVELGECGHGQDPDIIGEHLMSLLRVRERDSLAHFWGGGMSSPVGKTWQKSGWFGLCNVYFLHVNHSLFL